MAKTSGKAKPESGALKPAAKARGQKLLGAAMAAPVGSPEYEKAQDDLKKLVHTKSNFYR